MKKMIQSKSAFIYLFIFIIFNNCSNYFQLKEHKYPDIRLTAPTPNNWQNQIQKENFNFITNGWIEEFNDPKITLIAKQALENNQDLAMSLSRLKAAEASAKIAGADLKPTANLNLNNKKTGDFDESNTINNVGASIDVSWEIDLWGRIEAGANSAREDYEASKADYIAAKESLIAQTIKAYLLAIDTLQQFEIAQETKKSFEKELQITEVFYELGEKSIQDVAIAKANLASSKETVLKYKNSHEESVRSLELLIGVYPAGKYSISSNFPVDPGPVPTGIPSDILENRPDIKAKERQIASAFNATKSAKAAKLPSIALTSNIGSSSDGLKNLNNPSNMFWNFAGNLLIPLFNDGTLQNNVIITESEQKAAIAEYKQAALTAFNEVETALNNEQSLRKRIELLNLNYEQSEIAYKIESDKYQLGEGNILDVSQLNRNLITSKAAIVTAERQILTEKINLYLALGIPAFNNQNNY
jgi:NodT family efflux transporter outer membrane factor (OMF) lipoprotein